MELRRAAIKMKNVMKFVCALVVAVAVAVIADDQAQDKASEKSKEAEASKDTNVAVVVVESPTTAHISGDIRYVNWMFDTKTNVAYLTVVTNLLTNWVTQKELQYVGSNVLVRQEGTIQTNRSMLYSYRPHTNVYIPMDILGEEKWNSQRREILVPRVR
jgi:hypothetical protein